jgi:hypothetical protein
VTDRKAKSETPAEVSQSVPLVVPDEASAPASEFVPAAIAEPASIVIPAIAPRDHVVSSGMPMSVAMRQHLASHLGEADLHARIAQNTEVVCKPLQITVKNLRANSKAFVVIRDDQAAVWSEGDGTGLVGLSFSTSRDPALYVRNFLINAREFYVQTYNTCQEILISLYVLTAQPTLRGRIDLPPGAIVTLQSTTERVSLVGLSAFAIDF